MIDTSKLTSEWLAGFFDGEGCICISIHGRLQSLRINITQSDHELLMSIKEKFGASYGPYRKGRRTRSGRGSVVYEVGWYGNKCRSILELLRDRVVVKKPQVEIALQFLELMWSRGGNGRVTKTFSQEEWSSREVLRQQLRDINHAGPKKPISPEHTDLVQ